MSHWYWTKDGVPQRYFQYKKNGEVSQRINRGQALADGAVESVTTLLKLVGDSGGLVQWACNTGIAAGINVCSSNANDVGDLLALAKAEAKERMERAANEGTAIHDSIERRLTDDYISDDPVQKKAQDDVELWLHENGVEGWKAEHCLVYRGVYGGDWTAKLAFGGTADLIADGWVIDFKTVEDGGRGFRDPKPSECAQLAAYRLAASSVGLCGDGARCVNLYVDRTTGRLVKAHEWTNAMLFHGLSMLACATMVSQLTDKIEASIKRSKE